MNKQQMNKQQRKGINMIFNGNLPKLITGALVSVPLTVMAFMGNGIVKNRETSIVEHTNIIKDQVVSDEALREKISNVRNIVTGMNTRQEIMNHRQQEMHGMLKKLNK